MSLSMLGSGRWDTTLLVDHSFSLALQIRLSLPGTHRSKNKSLGAVINCMVAGQPMFRTQRPMI
jgi:hypothetical protein